MLPMLPLDWNMKNYFRKVDFFLEDWTGELNFV